MFEVSNLRTTIVPKSDQLNAEQLLGGGMTVTVSDVRIGSDDQPVIVHYDGDDGRPYKPCKTMRKLLIFAWGEDGRDWIGKSMTLYNDQAVKFGGMAVGGIRISEMTDIERDIAISLTATKGKKALHTVKLLKQTPLRRVLAAIADAKTLEQLGVVGNEAALLKNAADKETARAAFAARRAQLKAAPVAATAPPLPAAASTLLADYKAAVDTATSAETAQLAMDEAQGLLTPEEFNELQLAYDMAWKE